MILPSFLAPSLAPFPQPSHDQKKCVQVACREHGGSVLVAFENPTGAWIINDALKAEKVIDIANVLAFSFNEIGDFLWTFSSEKPVINLFTKVRLAILLFSHQGLHLPYTAAKLAQGRHLCNDPDPLRAGRLVGLARVVSLEGPPDQCVLCACGLRAAGARRDWRFGRVFRGQHGLAYAVDANQQEEKHVPLASLLML